MVPYSKLGRKSEEAKVERKNNEFKVGGSLHLPCTKIVLLRAVVEWFYAGLWLCAKYVRFEYIRYLGMFEYVFLPSVLKPVVGAIRRFLFSTTIL